MRLFAVNIAVAVAAFGGINSVEHEKEGGVLIGQRITENNVTNADRDVNRLLKRIVSP